jgi:prepilin-type processing-associated H-X9-DG protein
VRVEPSPIKRTVQQYAIDNQGYMPPVRCGRPVFTAGAPGGKYNLCDIEYGASVIVPGVSDSQRRLLVGFRLAVRLVNEQLRRAGRARAGGISQGVISCPSFEKFPFAGGNNGSNLEWEPGYMGDAYNPHPTFAVNNPPLGTAYNILYCDGHVGRENMNYASYRSVRMRYPEK